MGAELGDAMMRLLPPIGWGDIATRRDLQNLEDRLTDRIDHKVDSLGQRLDARIDRVEMRLDAMTESMASMREQMATKADLADSQRELARTLVTWIFMAQATVVGAIGLLIAYLG
jgi:flagellar capping protein FliD